MVEALTFLAVVGAVACVGFLVPAFQPYRRPMPFVAFLLGISSGFPLTLLLATMTFLVIKRGCRQNRHWLCHWFDHTLHTQVSLGTLGRQVVDSCFNAVVWSASKLVVPYSGAVICFAVATGRK